MHKPRAIAVLLSSIINIPENSLKVMNRLKQSDKNNSSLPAGIMCPDNNVHGPCNSLQRSAAGNLCRRNLNSSPTVISYVLFPKVLRGAGLRVWGKTPHFLHPIPALSFSDSPSWQRLSQRWSLEKVLPKRQPFTQACTAKAHTFLIGTWQELPPHRNWHPAATGHGSSYFYGGRALLVCVFASPRPVPCRAQLVRLSSAEPSVCWSLQVKLGCGRVCGGKIVWIPFLLS